MDVSSLTVRAQIGAALEVATQARTLDDIRAQGVALQQLIASAPAGSVNLPSQGRHLDAVA
jgi:hypothetical protein